MLVRVVAPALLFAIAFAIRVLPWKSVYIGDRVIPYGNDAYYHLRRIRYTLANFPETLRFDSYINYPEGGEPIWSPLFDWVAACGVRVFGGAADLESRLVLLPPLLGSLAVVCLFFVARAHWGTRVALLGAALLALFPAHFNYSRIGFIDHHAAVAWVSVGILGFGLRRVSAATGILWWAASGAVAGIAILLWPGSLLHVGLAESIVAGIAASRASAREARRAALGFAFANLIAAAVVAPFCWGNSWLRWGDYSPAVLTKFQPSFFVALALLGGLFAVVTTVGDAWGRRARAGVTLVLAGGMASLLLVFVPGLPADLQGAFGEAWRWFGKAEAFQAQVRESRPLFMEAGRFQVSTALTQLSGFVFAVPAIALALLWRGGGPERFLGLWTLGLLCAAMVQARFVNSAAPAIALSAAWAGFAIWDAAKARARPDALPWLRIGVVLFGIVFLVPSLASYLPHLRAAWTTEPPSSIQARKRMLTRTAEWLRDETPETAGFLGPGDPEYAVLSDWSDGHLLKYVARRPTLADNFGDDVGPEGFRAVETFYLANEVAANRLLEERGVRYVLFESRPLPYRRNFAPDSMLSRLYFFDGEAGLRSFSRSRGAFVSNPGSFAAVTRYRLVYESRAKSWQKRALPGFKIYEFVPGALVKGRAAPAATVEARLGIRTHTGRSFEYVARVRADASGSYALRFPYASGTDTGWVAAQPTVELRSGAFSASLSVSEQAVAQGLPVPGPKLGPSVVSAE